MAVETTPLGFKKPDNNEMVKFGAHYMTLNAQRTEELLGNALGRLGQAEANIQGGLGSGPGLHEDPDNAGMYFMAETSPLTEDPASPGLYTF